MLGSNNLAVLQSCLTKFTSLSGAPVDPAFTYISLEGCKRFENNQVATAREDFCVGCGEYLLFDGYFLKSGMFSKN